MRVIGGKAKGTQLRIPQGGRVRPATSLAKQAIFSILENTAVNWGRILDLFAGSGALGIEALSRGATWGDFVDQSKKCCSAIEYNLERAGFSSRSHVYCCNVAKAIAFLGDVYDIVFMDPPYSEPSVGSLIATLVSSHLIGEDSAVVVLHGNRFPLDSGYDGLSLLKQRQYGDTFISIFQRED